MTDINPGTPRLQLDPPVRADRDAVFAIASDPRTWAHIPGERITDPARVEAALEMFGTGWREHGLSHWVVRVGEDGANPGLERGRVLGTGGVHLFETEAGSRIWNLGYRLDPACWGHGFATELARTAVASAGEKLAEVPVIARVLSTNPASVKVAQKAGLQLRWEGSPSPQTVAAVGDESVTRLILADRELEPEVRDWLVSRG
ncbi:GNAT family N-acetyltransferase [Paeniglutamicibacter sp. MACA_103]|uniref:GNAT family N-acetyltransferase n=1 Tax=Paeniglutamicibacter sp. MACA_103 TaxID=3377337 RepID=UPI003895ED95